MEGRDDIGLEEIDQDDPLVQVRLDQVGDPLMRLAHLAPMNAGLYMVGGMITIVEQHEIGKTADEVAGMVIDRLLIGMHVLDIVEQHDGEQSHLLGNDDIQ